MLSKFMEGMRECAEKKDFDIYVFLSFASYSVHQYLMQGELNVYKLCDPADFDGVVVFSNMLNSDDTARAICRDAKKKSVPVVSIGMKIDGIPSICGLDNAGMRSLVTHLIEEHGVKRIFYIGGTEDHPDSNERLRITREVMEKHGLSLIEKEIAYGKWSNRRTIDALDELLKTNGCYPDAFICANDIMALAVCTELEKRGIRVPQDIKVTGFDNIADGRYFYPALATVEQDYASVAKRAYEIIFGESEKRRSSKRFIVPTHRVPGESCGCADNPTYARLRREYCMHSFQREMDSKLLEQNERDLRERLADVSDYMDMKDKLKRHYIANHQYEGSAFYLVFNEEYFENVMATEEELCAGGLKGNLDVVVAIRDDKTLDAEQVNVKQLIPGYRKKKKEHHCFYICPLHYSYNNYGYVVFADDPYVLNESIMYPYLEKVQQSIRLLRVNLRLKLLYDKDPMTGLYNRLGYENKALPLYQESLKKLSKMSVLFVDINNMKTINDHHGHEQGDVAIRTVAASIADCLQKDWIAVRYGGDEFLLFIPDCAERRSATIKGRIEERLQERIKANGLPYPLSVSIGCVTTNPKKRTTASLKEYIREADALMYKIKEEMHSRNKRRRK